MESIEAVKAGLLAGLIDKNSLSLEQYRPRLLINDSSKGQKVLTSLITELRQCEEFFFSVAFITESGVVSLLNTLIDLEKKNVKGRIIASRYLEFTQPKALKRLLDFKNIDLRIVTSGNHHTKGYIFRKKDVYSLIVGSSNLTQNALSSNKEWNLKISSMEKGSLIHETLSEFDTLYQSAIPVTGEWIDQYEAIYIRNLIQKSQVNKPEKGEISNVADYRSGYQVDYQISTAKTPTFQLDPIMPNKMQIKALLGIDKLRDEGEKKALLVSATGTGKTYLAAFDVRKVEPARLLFIAHREQLLNQAMESFKKVIGDQIECGKLMGNLAKRNIRYLFSTVQTLSKDEYLYSFRPDDFDYIIVDESHRAGANTYQKILNYLKPDFLLGMTATPERTDEHNICADFDYNIAYEIRLQEAMEEDLLCPFHYFGISEIMVEGQLIDDTVEFKYLTSDERVNHIISQLKRYGHDSNKVNGLVFCSRNEEAKTLSEKFNLRGYKTISLSGSDSSDRREEMIRRLEGDGDDKLDYIFSVDLFNEGLDVPTLNQIIMLRPTQSAIIFVQQLGRGLRKAQNKEFVVVLDFIGNYKNNFMIPMALSDDRSFNKDTIRRYTVEGTRVIPGASTINFDEISRSKIYEAIDQVNFASVKYMKESYLNLKYRLGRIPTFMDFETHDSMDLEVLFNSNTGSYHEFLKKYEEDYYSEFNEIQEVMITFISKKLAIGKRPHELLVLKYILEGKLNPLSAMKKKLETEYRIEIKEKTLTNVTNVLTNQFLAGTGKNTFKYAVFLDGENASSVLLKQLKDEVFRKYLLELVDYGLFRNAKYYGNRYQNSAFSLYQKYSYEDACRLLEWDKCGVAQNIGGYKYDEKSKTYPVFINYHKSEDIDASINYQDRFLSPSRIIAISKHRRRLSSNDVRTALESQKYGIDMELFVRKNKDDKGANEFYYLGKMIPTGEAKEFLMRDTNKTAVEINYQLDVPVREDIYEYLSDIPDDI
ncbi:DEAD/DEAH box helicase [Eubacteriaceae bacterium ES3]|nr:DEAD/DEAH box helicase [Eubacteriaceae bacterium ES3]